MVNSQIYFTLVFDQINQNSSTEVSPLIQKNRIETHIAKYAGSFTTTTDATLKICNRHGTYAIKYTIDYLATEYISSR